MNPDRATRFFTRAYVVLFFVFLFGPLVIMSATAFNSFGFPRLAPWECLTFEWFHQAANDTRLKEGLMTSAVIGLGVIVLSVTLGLAGALMLTQIWPRVRAAYYTVVISPILMPGVVLGISTYLFWNRIEQATGAGSGSLFTNGMLLTIFGQSSFISAYCMLVFLARLQRFDMGQMEAALDLGASNAQAFRKVLLPFLKPAIGSAAVLAFLASFENYNTTVFTISHYYTFTTEIAQKVKLGLNPSISSIAVVIIFLSLAGALVHEAWSRYSERRLKTGAAGPGAFFAGNVAAWMSIAVIVAGVATVWVGKVHSAAECKAEVLREKMENQRRLEEERQRRLRERQQQQQQQGTTPAPAAPAERPASPFGNVFDPGNLRGTGPQETPAPSPAPAPASPFGNVFDPGNLRGTGPQATPAPQ